MHSPASSKSYLLFTPDTNLLENNTLIVFSPPSNTVKDKANHAVVLDKATHDKLQKDVQSYRLITVATLVDRLKINGSLARQSLKDLEDKGQIKKVVGHSKLSIYSKCYPSLSYWSEEHSRGRGDKDERQGNGKSTMYIYGGIKDGYIRESTDWITGGENAFANSYDFQRAPLPQQSRD